MSSFSRKGPTVNGHMKPDNSAPGEDVRSAWSTDPNDYLTASGASMATPYVAGVVALMFSVHLSLTYCDQVKEALFGSTESSTCSS